MLSYTAGMVDNEGKILTLAKMRFVLDCKASSGDLSRSYQEKPI